jgi:hypothetical protein
MVYMKTLTIQIEDKDHMNLKLYAAKRGLTIREVVLEGIELRTKKGK